MHNSLVTHLRGYVEAMFKDIAFAYRRDSEWSRDKARLIHELEAHGERVLTVDLPALSKHLDKCLAEELYTPSRLPYGATARRIKVPVFLRDLYLQLFSESGKLLERPSETVVAALRQLLLGCKKILLPCSRRGFLNEVKNFIDVERGLCRPTLNWESDDMQPEAARYLSFTDISSVLAGPDALSEREANILSAVADRISASYGDLHEENPGEVPRHGPGVVADLKRGENKFSFLDWPAKLDRVFPYDRYASPNLGESQLAGLSLHYRNREVPSRLIAVPKDLTKPRLIAAEPSQHQFVQQLVRNQLEARLALTPIRRSISFRDQSQNQRRALLGSIDGSLTTIDLSAASDRLSCALVERFFRKNTTILERLHASRTRWLKIDLPGVEVQYLRLKKFAPMGSAVTFPVQSIVYAGLAVAAIHIDYGWRVSDASILKASKKVSVFGDDIIVPTDTCRTLIRILTLLGLKVNNDKTYSKGNFRESCGVEAYAGVDVTPARVLLPTSQASNGDVASLIQQSNNFWKKGWWNTAKWLETTFKHYRPLIPVVAATSTVIGLSSYTGSDTAHLKSRYSESLHRDEVRVLLPHSKVKRSASDGTQRLHQWFTEDPSPEILWEAGTAYGAVSDMRPGWTDSGRIRL